MPITTADKVQALSRDFGSQRRLAELLGVSPAQVTRWRQGQGIDELNAERVDLLELVMSNLLRVYPTAAAERWLVGLNPAARRPAAAGPDPARTGARAAGRDRGRARRQLRVILWRVLPWDPSARPANPGGALWFPRPFQGAARHDDPARYGCLYVAEDPVSAVAEALAPFRGTGDLRPEMLIRMGRALALAELALDDDAPLLDLDDPRGPAPRGPAPVRTSRRPTAPARAATPRGCSTPTRTRPGCAGGRRSRRAGSTSRCSTAPPGASRVRHVRAR